MKIKPMISVIMPVYNCGDFINQAINSILDQSFSDFELLIIDDGSFDETERVIAEFRDKRINYHRLEHNVGNYYARNIGLKVAKGNYVAVMDADDIALPKRLELQYNYLESHNDVLAVGTCFLFGIKGFEAERPHCYEHIKLALLDNNCILHPSLMIRKSVLDDLSGYNEIYKYSADYDLVCRIANKGAIINLPETLMVYRWHKSQISQSKHAEQQMYADKIRIQYHRQFISKYSSSLSLAVDDYMIRDAKMGRVIALFLYSKHSSCIECVEIANSLLDEIVDNLTPNGIPGIVYIGCGIIFLIRNSLVEGNEDEVLEAIDSLMDDICINLDEMNLEEDVIVAWTHYLRLRINSCSEDIYNIRMLTNIQNIISLLSWLKNRESIISNSLIYDDIVDIHNKKLCPALTDVFLNILANCKELIKK